jgi:short-subunit dehydrogenase
MKTKSRQRRREGRIVWITGASSGLGLSLWKEFSKAGDYVIASSRSVGFLRRLQAPMVRKGEPCDVVGCDLRNAGQIERTARRILKRHGRIDVLINNAGVTAFSDFLTTSVREFDKILDTNLRAPFLCVRGVLPSMMRTGHGIIVNIISYAAKTTYTGSSAYSASKAGMQAMMNVVREEYRDKGIKVVNVFPGSVLTPMWKPKHRKKFAGVMMDAAELARLIRRAIETSETMTVEELVVRPQVGDLTL